MPRIERRATVRWEGSVARGSGTISPESGAFEALPFTLASRIAEPRSSDSTGKSSPEELLAAAHAGCFAMSLGSELARDGTPPRTLEVDCTIVMDEVEGHGHQIVGSQLRLTVDADAAGEALDEAIARADEGCPFSALLRRAGADVSIER
jgi:lipoyl-dependent peroxiredoxin